MSSYKQDDAFQPAALVRTEAAALEVLATRLEGPMAAPFARAVDMILGCGEQNGRVVVTGMGKSGLVARKISATLSSTGTPSFFLHPADAVHGDLGMLARGDAMLGVSYGGETDEIVTLLEALRRLEIPLVMLTGKPKSTLGDLPILVLFLDQHPIPLGWPWDVEGKKVGHPFVN